jgi:hypothetical protein
MFLGHFAVAFAVKRAAPRTSLGVTFAAAQLADMLWPIFLLLGWEQVRIVPNANPNLTLVFTSYPWSHSLLMAIVWGALFGLLYFAMTKYSRGAIVVALLVPSHWVLDVVAHVPDLPLYPGGSTRLGLGLWSSPVASIVVEAILFLAGLTAYANVTHARDRVGRFGLLGLAAFLVVLYVAALVGPPPPNVTTLALTALIGWPLALWPWWVDRHRDSGVGRS